MLICFAGKSETVEKGVNHSSAIVMIFSVYNQIFLSSIYKKITTWVEMGNNIKITFSELSNVNLFAVGYLTVQYVTQVNNE